MDRFPKEEVRRFFDSCAGAWDEDLTVCAEKIGTILDNAQVGEGSRVLDVGCGTGVLIPFYLSRNAAEITALDLSPEMIRLAREKFPQEKIRFICGDADTAEVGNGFDAIVIYNAFPHIPDPGRTIRHLGSLLKIGGILTVAHGMSREKVDAHHHSERVRKVSCGLMEAEKLAELFAETLKVTAVISNEEMYQVAGMRLA